MPKSVAGKLVSTEESERALAVLAIFNEATGRSYHGREHLIDIIGRLREHPDLSDDDHRRLVAKLLRQSWWRRPRNGNGPTLKVPSPAHAYGSGKALDALLNADEEEAPTGPDLSVYDKGSR